MTFDEQILVDRIDWRELSVGRDNGFEDRVVGGRTFVASISLGVGTGCRGLSEGASVEGTSSNCCCNGTHVSFHLEFAVDVEDERSRAGCTSCGNSINTSVVSIQKVGIFAESTDHVLAGVVLVGDTVVVDGESILPQRYILPVHTNVFVGDGEREVASRTTETIDSEVLGSFDV